jgi:hypothetical protein
MVAPLGSAFVTKSSPASYPSSALLATRRNFLVSTGGAFAGLVLASPAYAEETVASMIEELESSKLKLKSVPGLIQAENWEGVRQILKSPPVNNLWNMGDAKNTLFKIAKATDEFGLVEIKDELSISLQICDQLVYDNVFVYYQPGNGKVKVKEPADLAVKAIAQLGEAIEMAKSI